MKISTEILDTWMKTREINTFSRLVGNVVSFTLQIWLNLKFPTKNVLPYFRAKLTHIQVQSQTLLSKTVKKKKINY